MARKNIDSVFDRNNRNAMNENFKELYEGIETASEWKEKSDAILDEARRVNNDNVDVQQQIDSLILESGTSDAEVIQARGNHTVLSERLNISDKKLADTNSRIRFMSNAEYPLVVPTYDGSNQSVHPDVIYFDTAWNGYKYWMAYTPYPFTNDALENPCIIASNDGIKWVVPAGLVNPIDKPSQAELDTGHHFSDAILIRNGSTLECWYRWNKNGSTEQLYRQTSTDGKTWGNKELILDYTGTGQAALSPSVILEDGLYKMWFVGYPTGVYYTQSTTGKLNTWSEPVRVPISNYVGGGTEPWHLSMFKDTDGTYQMILNSRAYENGERDLMWGSSTDGLSFDTVKTIMKTTVGTSRWDNAFLYRASLTKVGNIYKLYYSARSQSGVWKIGMVEGEKIDTLSSNAPYTSSGEFVVEKVESNSVVSNKVQFGHPKAFVEDNVLQLYKLGVASARIITESSGIIKITGEGGTEFTRLQAGALDVTDVEAKNVRGDILNVNIIKGRTGTAKSVRVHELLTVRENDSGESPLLKILHAGVAGAGISINRANTLKIMNDGNTRTGHMELSGVIFSEGETVPNIEGAIRYNKSTKKHEGYNGTSWNALY